MKSQFPILRAVAGALLFSIAVSQAAESRPAAQAAATSPARSIGTRSKLQGVANFGQVTPNLYRGALPSTAGIKALKKLGINVVIDLRGSPNKIEEETVTGMGMQYVSIRSHCPFPSDEPWARFLSAMRENAGKKVFVHCRLGDDRTGMAVAAYRMSEQDWSPQEAMNEMRAFGFSGVHHAICMGMAHYEQTFPQRLKTSPAFKDLGLQKPTPK